MITPFTVRIFAPDGDPEGLRIISRSNRTAVSLVFPRDKWVTVKDRQEFQNSGIYVLVGYDETDDDLPLLYIGQAENLESRINNHYINKDFWDWGFVFTTNSNELNRGHISWLEHSLIKRAREANRAKIENSTSPNEANLAELDKADAQVMLYELLQVFPLVGLKSFEIPKIIRPNAIVSTSNVIPTKGSDLSIDTLIVPAKEEGFNDVFLGKNCWYAVRIKESRIEQIKYIAAYRSAPISAVTHYAKVASIEPYGEGGKYKINFAEPAQAIGPVVFGDLSSGAMQGPRYTAFSTLTKSKTLSEAFKSTG